MLGLRDGVANGGWVGKEKRIPSLRCGMTNVGAAGWGGERGTGGERKADSFAALRNDKLWRCGMTNVGAAE
jgi:hypothetical protein